jgi:hypothetical protein
MRFVHLRPIFVLLLASVAATAVFAQGPNGVGSRPITPAEQLRGVQLYGMIGMANDDGTVRIPMPLLDSAVAQRAHRWVETLKAAPVIGIQLDPMGTLAVKVGQDGLAKQQFAARLTTFGLSTADRAYTYLQAIAAFSAHADNQERMRTALAYVPQLDALSNDVALEKFHARIILANAYFSVGDGTSVLKQLNEALPRFARLPFDERNWGVMHATFVLLGNVLSGQPNGRAKIDSIAKWLAGYVEAPPELAAKNPSYYTYRSNTNRGFFDNAVNLVGYLGRQAPDIEAQYWFNTDAPATPSGLDPKARKKVLNDGKIRVMEYGHYGCPGCLASLPGMERIRKAAPSSVEVWYVAIEGDVWGATPQTPDQMAEHYHNYYVKRKKYGLPIAIWIGERSDDVNGGTSNAGSPTFSAYDFRGWPWFIVTDGKGIVRFIQMGLSESLLTNTMRYLVAETARTDRAAN